MTSCSDTDLLQRDIIFVNPATEMKGPDKLFPDGELMGYPVVLTTHVPVGEVWFWLPNGDPQPRVHRMLDTPGVDPRLPASLIKTTDVT